MRELCPGSQAFVAAKDRYSLWPATKTLFTLTALVNRAFVFTLIATTMGLVISCKLHLRVNRLPATPGGRDTGRGAPTFVLTTSAGFFYGVGSYGYGTNRSLASLTTSEPTW
jgi:hypothetical protein